MYVKLAEEHETTTERQSGASGPSITQSRSNSELAHETGLILSFEEMCFELRLCHMSIFI